MNPDVHDDYAAGYRFAIDAAMIAIISREDGRLFYREAGDRGALELFPEAEDAVFISPDAGDISHLHPRRRPAGHRAGGHRVLGNELLRGDDRARGWRI